MNKTASELYRSFVRPGADPLVIAGMDRRALSRQVGDLRATEADAIDATDLEIAAAIQAFARSMIHEAEAESVAGLRGRSLRERGREAVEPVVATKAERRTAMEPEYVLRHFARATPETTAHANLVRNRELEVQRMTEAVKSQLAK